MGAHLNGQLTRSCCATRRSRWKGLPRGPGGAQHDEMTEQRSVWRRWLAATVYCCGQKLVLHGVALRARQQVARRNYPWATCSYHRHTAGPMSNENYVPAVGTG